MMLRGGNAERQRLYKQIWIGYGLRFLLMLCIFLVSIIFLMRKLGPIQEWLNLPVPMFMVALEMLVDYFARKSLLAVAATDILLVTFLRSEHWRLAWEPTDKAAFEDSITELGRLLKPDESVVQPQEVDIACTQETCANGNSATTTIESK